MAKVGGLDRGSEHKRRLGPCGGRSKQLTPERAGRTCAVSHRCTGESDPIRDTMRRHGRQRGSLGVSVALVYVSTPRSQLRTCCFDDCERVFGARKQAESTRSQCVAIDPPETSTEARVHSLIHRFQRPVGRNLSKVAHVVLAHVSTKRASAIKPCGANERTRGSTACAKRYAMTD